MHIKTNEAWIWAVIKVMMDCMQIKRKPTEHDVLNMRKYLSLRLNETDRTFTERLG